MGKRANPTVIGAFVLGAIALAVAGVMVFGSGQFFKRMEHFVMFFSGSVNGLSVGAPVKFKGVDIGRVTEIQLVLERDKNTLTIPVYVETDPSKIIVDHTRLKMSNPENVQALIKRGMRAQLQTQSLVTGLLFVQIDFFPDTTPTYVLKQPSDPLEIPTIPTTLEQASSAAREIINELRAVKFGPMVQEATDALHGINALVNSPALHTAVDGLPATMQNVNETVADVRKLTGSVRGEIDPIAKRLDDTLASADQALATVRETAAAARLIIEPGSPLDHDLRTTLRDVAAAARAMTLLADYLQQNPTALLYGKPPQVEDKP